MLLRIKQILIFFVLAFFYFFLRLGWPETIEFGHDQPWFSLDLIKIIDSGDFINIGQYLKNNPVAENTFTWGPFAFYFYMPFFIISRNPIVISQLIAIVNGAGIIFIYLTGKELYNNRIGILAALFSAVFPWSVIFSRMVYTPTPLFLFVPLSIYLTVKLIKENCFFPWLYLPIVWSIMLNFHLISINIILVNILAIILYSGKKIKIKQVYNLTLGIVLALLIWIPFFKYEKEHNFRYLQGFLKATKQLSKNSQELYADKFVVIKNIYEFFILQDFEFQLDGSLTDFKKTLPFWWPNWNKFFALVVLGSFSFCILRIIYYSWQKKYSSIIGDIIIISSYVFTAIFISKIHLAEIVPRYFIMLIPSLSLMMALAIDNLILSLAHVFKIKYYLYILAVCLLAGSNAVFMRQYYHFIKNYNGYNGYLSSTSNPAYYFTLNSLKWVLNDAENRGFEKFTVSSQMTTTADFDLNWEQKYVWEQIFKRNYHKGSFYAHYFVLSGKPPAEYKENEIIKFGAYQVIKQPIIYHIN